ncbi:sigma factor [Paenarthrobacter sp. RAF54_2]|uniref:sigma factor n=1 Tax=Paenarthrobacter sp. RAF54_2 TaxID=3233061 RepID=UPI003F95B3AF
MFDRHSRAVFRYCLSRTASWRDAEELVSVTFLEAWWQRRNLSLQRESLLQGGRQEKHSLLLEGRSQLRVPFPHRVRH